MRLLALNILTITTLTAGCVTTALAPGAAQVKIVRNPADVAACTAVGNVVPDRNKAEDPRNLTVGLGGNTVLVTTEVFGNIVNGVAYRCP
jgi:hypothetical protein